MNFDDLKDQFKEKFQSILGEIQDNSTFQNLREKYETLPANTQKIILIVSGILVSIFLMSFPYGYFSASNEHILEFNSHRALIRELLSISKEQTSGPIMDRNITIAQLRDLLVKKVESFNLLPTQVGKIQPINPLRDSLAKPPINEEAISVQLSSLNLTQIVDIGFAFQQIMPNVKMTGLTMVESSKDKGYFDTVYTLSNFNFPQTNSDASSSNQRKKRNRK